MTTLIKRLCQRTVEYRQEENKTFKLRHFRGSGRVLNCQLTEVQQKQTSVRRFRDGECQNIPHRPQ